MSVELCVNGSLGVQSWETCGYNYCYLISVVILDYEGSLFNDFTIGLKARARTAQLK